MDHLYLIEKSNILEKGEFFFQLIEKNNYFLKTNISKLLFLKKQKVIKIYLH
jgi:hypothetical protein